MLIVLLVYILYICEIYYIFLYVLFFIVIFNFCWYCEDIFFFKSEIFFDCKECIYCLVLLLNFCSFFLIRGVCWVDIDVICWNWLLFDIIEIDILIMLDKNSNDFGMLFFKEENYCWSVWLVKLNFDLIFDFFVIVVDFNGNWN